MLAALRAVLRGTRLNVPEIAGVPLSEIEALRSVAGPRATG